MKIFDFDGPVMRVLSRVADLMWLNILTLVCCIPIVTIGASLTAMHYVALRMWRNEEGYITKDFFKSFKLNFKQATIIWFILAVCIAVIAGDAYIILKMDMGISKIVSGIIAVAAVAVALTAVMVFPLLARFTNTTKNTIRNAFAASIVQLPKTLLMIVVAAIPPVLFVLSWRLFPIVFLFGLSAPAFVWAILYNKTFETLEKNYEAATNGTTKEPKLEDVKLNIEKNDE